MSGRWAGRSRAPQLPPDWNELRRFVAARAGGRCEAFDSAAGARCAEPGTECHHAGAPDDHRPEVLQWLCTEHHMVITQQQAADALRRIYGKARYPRRGSAGLLS